MQEWDIPKPDIWVTLGAIGSPANAEWIQTRLTNLKSVNVREGSYFIQQDHSARIGREIAEWYGEL